MSESVHVERRGAVLVMTLDRPEVRNAINGELSEQLADAFDLLDADPDLAVGVLTGAGGHFCAGLDLKDFSAGVVPNVRGRGLTGLVETPPRKPLVAAVEGAAIAGGFELVLCCDLVVASSEARFGLPEVKRGLVAAGGGLLRLPRRIPWHQALAWLLTGDLVSAAEADRSGLIHRVVEPGQALPAALELAERIAANGPLAVLASKQIATLALDWPVDEGFTRQQEYVDPVIASADAREGATAFVERRAPRWEGR